MIHLKCCKPILECEHWSNLLAVLRDVGYLLPTQSPHHGSRGDVGLHESSRQEKGNHQEHEDFDVIGDGHEQALSHVQAVIGGL